MTTSRVPALPAHGRLREPNLTFHPDRREDVSTHPLEGLLNFGPYSRSLLSDVLDPIRIATIGPAAKSRAIERLIRELSERQKARERQAYLPDFPGFNAVFGVRIVSVPGISVELPSSLTGDLAKASRPHAVLSQSLTGAISAIAARRSEYDVLFIYLPDEWSAGFTGTG